MTVPQGMLPFKLIPDTDTSIVTSFAGLPLVVETMRALGVHRTVDEALHMKKRERGTYTESDYVESFIALFAAGGSCLDDFARLQADKGLNTSAFLSRLPNPPGSSSMPFMRKNLSKTDRNREPSFPPRRSP